MSVHTGFEVLILLLDLSKALIQLHIFVFLERQNQKGMRTVEDNSYFHLHLTSSYQLFQFHQLLLLLVKLLGFDIQNHLEAVQLLLQVQSVRVSLLGKARDGSSLKSPQLSSCSHTLPAYMAKAAKIQFQ